jgi:energy-coupling factor transporter ATP-binding protein EcfA2
MKTLCFKGFSSTGGNRVKVNVIGTSGSGKSTLAKRIAAELDIPYIEMDRLYWCPDWQGTPDAILLEKLETTLKASAEWVLDGNYNRTRPVKWVRPNPVSGCHPSVHARLAQTGTVARYGKL